MSNQSYDGTVYIREASINTMQMSCNMMIITSMMSSCCHQVALCHFRGLQTLSNQLTIVAD